MSILNNYHDQKHFLQTTHFAGFSGDFRPFIYMKNHGSAAVEAMTVIEDVLKEFSQPEGTKRLVLAGARDLKTDQTLKNLKASDHYKFTFVRDPIERLVSAYKVYIEVESKPRQILCEEMGWNAKDKIEISDFIKALSTNPKAFDLNRHWRLQRKEISFDEVSYDFIGTTRNYASSLAHICKAVFNKAPNGSFPTDIYADHHELHSLLSDLTPEDFENLKRIYQPDFKMLEMIAQKHIPEHVVATALEESADKSTWKSTLAEIGANEGFFEEIGRDHSALFVQQGKTLIVTFENLDHVHRGGGDRMPWGYDFVKSQGWSMLGMMAHGWTWYRDEAVFDFFDRLRDEGFYEQFDNVVFYGASMGGYAASVFSASCPGANVILISPQATIDPKVVPWEYRYPKAKNQPFEGRYSYGPDMIKSAGKAYLFIDPHQKIDVQHANLFDSSDVEIYHSFYCGHRIASLWQQFKILKWVVLECVAGTLTPKAFYHKLRVRLENRRYRIEMVERLQKKERWGLLVMYCQGILKTQNAPIFRKYLVEAQQKLKEAKS